MSDHSHRVYVEGVDWHSLIPSLRLFRAFRIAIGPSKLFLAMCLVVLTYLGGLVLDSVWGQVVFPHEVDAYLEQTQYGYEAWLEEQRDTERQLQGIFSTTLQEQLLAFRQLLVSALSFDLGLRGFLSAESSGSGGVRGALAKMVIGIPGWLYQTHPGFLAVFLFYLFVLTVIFGGAICRLAALHATRQIRASPFAGLRFGCRYFTWFVTAAVLPLGIIVGLGAMMAIAGLLLNFPVTDIAVSLIFGLLLVVGFLVALLLIGFAGAANLLFPALAIEGTDGFDAISRGFGYVLQHPWRYLTYSIAALIHGAITYSFVAFLVFLVLWSTKTFVGLWVWVDVADAIGRFDAILPDPALGRLPFHADTTDQQINAGWTVAISRSIVTVWVKLLIGLLPAFAFSYYFCAQTWIYLLLRQAADGTEMEQVYLENEEKEAAETVTTPASPETAEGDEAG